jgi:hypothetical protein
MERAMWRPAPGAPDAEQPDPAEALRRQAVQEPVRNIAERRGAPQPLAHRPEQRAQIDLVEQRRRMHRAHLLMRSKAKDADTMPHPWRTPIRPEADCLESSRFRQRPGGTNRAFPGLPGASIFLMLARGPRIPLAGPYRRSTTCHHPVGT